MKALRLVNVKGQDEFVSYKSIFGYGSQIGEITSSIELDDIFGFSIY